MRGLRVDAGWGNDPFRKTLDIFDSKTLVTVGHYLAVIAVFLRVVMMRPQTGVALAWIAIVAAFPLAGVAAYLLVGDKRISQRDDQRLAGRKTDFDEFKRLGLTAADSKIDWSRHPKAAKQMAALGQFSAGLPAVHGNDVKLFGSSLKALDRIIADIDQARESVMMEFYIWDAEGKPKDVCEALKKAASRGVRCRLLVDDVGAGDWLDSEQPDELREAGVEIAKALEVGPIRSLFSRTDLRTHRKLIIIDGKVGYCGSLNMLDRRVFEEKEDVDEWVDSMVRMEGPAVKSLGLVLLADWQREEGGDAAELLEWAGLDSAEEKGDVEIQVLPSGPGREEDEVLQMTLSLIFAAGEEVILTTPYFVPDESLLRALRNAAMRGLRVHLIIPKQTDSRLAKFAGQSYYEELMEAGVRIQRYQGGIVHTKSISVDGRLAMYGTANYDVRSLWINYEISLIVYSDAFATKLRQLQMVYLERCEDLDIGHWRKRPMWERLIENTCRLLSPLL